MSPALAIFAMLEQQTSALGQCLTSLANSWGIRAAIQFTSITSTEQRADMQASSSDKWREPFSSQFPFLQLCKGSDQWRVSPAMLKAEKAWVWQTPETLYWESGRLIYCRRCCIFGFQESCRYQESRGRKSNNFCHPGRISSCLSSMSCQSFQLMGRSWSNSVHMNHQYRTACTNDHCGRTVIFLIFIFCKGSDQWRVSPCNVEKWERSSFADTWDLVLARGLVADATV